MLFKPFVNLIHGHGWCARTPLRGCTVKLKVESVKKTCLKDGVEKSPARDSRLRDLDLGARYNVTQKLKKKKKKTLVCKVGLVHMIERRRAHVEVI